MQKIKKLQRIYSSKRMVNLHRNWYKFSRNPLSVLGLGLVLFIFILLIFAPVISPHPESAGKFVDF